MRYWKYASFTRVARRSQHRGQLCSDCKISRFRIGGPNNARTRIIMRRAFQFELFSRRSDAPRYWAAKGAE